ncbi:hypothetical protein M422DRAFT_191157, partial [Sphaerobolus stellatus SS14]
AYSKGLNGLQAAWAAQKYHGHQVLPENIMEKFDQAHNMSELILVNFSQVNIVDFFSFYKFRVFKSTFGSHVILSACLHKGAGFARPLSTLIQKRYLPTVALR